MLDINLFREGAYNHLDVEAVKYFGMELGLFDAEECAEKGGNPELVRESQRRRYIGRPDCNERVAMVDTVIAVDKQWREGAALPCRSLWHAMHTC